MSDLLVALAPWALVVLLAKLVLLVISPTNIRISAVHPLLA